MKTKKFARGIQIRMQRSSNPVKGAVGSEIYAAKQFVSLPSYFSRTERPQFIGEQSCFLYTWKNSPTTPLILLPLTPIWVDMISNTTIDVCGKRTITMKSTGHEKLRVTGVVAKGDRAKLKPIVVFKGKPRECQALQKEFHGKCMIASTKNGWMNTNLTLAWANSVLGQFSFRRRLLAWDTYECHLHPTVQSSLKAKKIDTAIIPEAVRNIFKPPMFAGINHLRQQNGSWKLATTIFQIDFAMDPGCLAGAFPRGYSWFL